MASDLLQRIELLNAQAVYWLSVGSFMEASKVSSCALRCLLPHVLGETAVENLLDRGHSPVVGMSPMRCVPAGVPSPQPDDRVFSIYSQGFLFAQDLLPGQLTVEGFRRLAASTVFNVALAHHLAGLQLASSQQSFQQALLAYKAAEELLSTITNDLDSWTEDTKVLALAIANNMGHIYEQLHEYKGANDCLQRLHNILPITYWSSESEHFHVTGVLFPNQGPRNIHSPAA